MLKGAQLQGTKLINVDWSYFGFGVTGAWEEDPMPLHQAAEFRNPNVAEV